MSLPEMSIPMNKNDVCCLIEENRESIFDNVDPTNHLGYKCKACQKSWWFDSDWVKSPDGDLTKGKYILNGKLRISTEFGERWIAATDKVIRSGCHLDMANTIKAFCGDNLEQNGKNDSWEQEFKAVWIKHTN